VVIGAAGILTFVPALDVLAALFGLGFIVWFAWVEIVMLRGRPGARCVKRPDPSNKGGRK
jgi:hypothetical protein